MVNRQWVLAARPEGPVKHSDFRLIETPLRPLADGEFRIRTRYLGVAAVMRGYMLNAEKFERPLAIGEREPPGCLLRVGVDEVGDPGEVEVQGRGHAGDGSG